MTVTRRTVLKSGVCAAAVATTGSIRPRSLLAETSRHPHITTCLDDPRIKQTIQRGLDCARGAGAFYADIRMTHRRTRNFDSQRSSDSESITVGVRVLVNGYWGFASGSQCQGDEVVRLATAATQLAKTNALGKSRTVVLTPVPPIVDGHWTMPVKIDPFVVSRAEIQDYLIGLSQYSTRYNDWTLKKNSASFTAIDKWFGSTDGSYYTQRTFASGGSIVWGLINQTSGRKMFGGLNDYLSVAGRGWELYLDQPLREGIRALHEELVEDTSFPEKPVDVGRFDAVFDAESLVGLVNGSIGAATQLDRALGYEANAGGTSYVTDPQSMLGNLPIGSSLLHVTANRTSPGGAATVQWDDEGVMPDDFTLVNHGVVSDFITTRESAGWMNDWKSVGGRLSHSHGCAAAPQGVDAPLAHIPNLVMRPGQEANDFTSLMRGLSKGVAVKNANVQLDFQQLNGFGRGSVYEVKNGRRTAAFVNPGMLLRTPEFWKSLIVIGGRDSAVRYGALAGRGEPPQTMVNSVDAVPVVVKDLSIVDVLRKA